MLGIPAADIVARHAEGAGCYGHNGADDVALDAALLARAVNGRPVRVQWMREDEFAWEPFGPAMVVKLRGALDGNGNVAEWRQEIWGNRHLTRPGRHPNPGLLAAWHLEPGHASRRRQWTCRSPWAAAASATPCPSTISPTRAW